jgi:hypothetical protein
MKKIIFTFMFCIYLGMYISYINQPPTDDEIFCAFYFDDVPKEVMEEPLMIQLHKEVCNGKN